MSLEINEEFIKNIYIKRDPDGFKGTFGKVLIIAGSENMQGAAALCALAAARAGSGTQTLFAPKPAAKALRAKLNEIMIISAPCKNGWFSKKAAAQLKKLIPAYDIICIGNGIGLKKGARKLVKTVLESKKLVVLDADAITITASSLDWLKREQPVILTPHIGEARRLFHSVKAGTEELNDFCLEYPQCTVVLKSKMSNIQSGTDLAVLNYPNSSLSKGGSGDTLAGIITGLWFYQKDPFHTACIGAYVHNQAASPWKNNPAYLPEDGLNELLNVFERLEN